MIDIPKLFPVVKKEFPGVPDKQIMAAMADFSKQHPDLDDQQALAAFNLAMQHPSVKKTKTPAKPFESLLGQVGA